MDSTALSRTAGAADADGLSAKSAAFAAETANASGAAASSSDAGLPSVAVLLMSRLRPAALPWALWRLARGAGSLGSWPGLRFAKVLGSGRDGGFGMRPGLDCQALFLMFDQLEQAHSFLSRSPSVRAYQQRATECFSAVLRVSSARGFWAGQGMAAGLGKSASYASSTAQTDIAEASLAPAVGPIAALTRASIRPSKALSFWRQSPPAEASLAAAEGCNLAVGLGEAPLLRQATFSIWRSAAAMDAYAHMGAHQQAIQAAWQGDFFSEWMFVRFKLQDLKGSWRGQDVAGLLHG